MIIFFASLIAVGFLILAVWNMFPDVNGITTPFPQLFNFRVRFLRTAKLIHHQNVGSTKSHPTPIKQINFEYGFIGTSQKMEKIDFPPQTYSPKILPPNLKSFTSNPWSNYAVRVGEMKDKISRLESPPMPIKPQRNSWENILNRLEKLEETIQVSHQKKPEKTRLEPFPYKQLISDIQKLENMSFQIIPTLKKRIPLGEIPEPSPVHNNIESEESHLESNKQLAQQVRKEQEALEAIRESFKALEPEQSEKESLQLKDIDEERNKLFIHKDHLLKEFRKQNEQTQNNTLSLQQESLGLEERIQKEQETFNLSIGDLKYNHQEAKQKLIQKSHSLEDHISRERENLKTALTHIQEETQNLHEQLRSRQKERAVQFAKRQNIWDHERQKLEQEILNLKEKVSRPILPKEFELCAKQKSILLAELQKKQLEWKSSLEQITQQYERELSLLQTEIRNGPEKRLEEERNQQNLSLEDEQSKLKSLRDETQAWENEQRHTDETFRLSQEKERYSYEERKNELLNKFQLQREKGNSIMETLRIEFSHLQEAFAHRQKDFTNRTQQMKARHQIEITQLRQKAEALETQMREGREKSSFELKIVDEDMRRVDENHISLQKRLANERETQRLAWEEEQNNTKDKLNQLKQSFQKLEKQRETLMISFQGKQFTWKNELDALVKQLGESLTRQKERTQELETLYTEKSDAFHKSIEVSLQKKKYLAEKIKNEEKYLDLSWKDCFSWFNLSFVLFCSSSQARRWVSLSLANLF